MMIIIQIVLYYFGLERKRERERKIFESFLFFESFR